MTTSLIDKIKAASEETEDSRPWNEISYIEVKKAIEIIRLHESQCEITELMRLDHISGRIAAIIGEANSATRALADIKLRSEKKREIILPKDISELIKTLALTDKKYSEEAWEILRTHDPEYVEFVNKVTKIEDGK